MRVTIDTTEALSFEPTEPGPYEMTVDHYDPPERSEKGNQYIFVYFKFDDPQIAKRCGHVRRAYVLEGKGAGFTREFWKAVTGEDIPLDVQFDVDLDDMIGRHVIVDITNEPYEGKLQNQVGSVASAG